MSEECEFPLGPYPDDDIGKELMKEMGYKAVTPQAATGIALLVIVVVGGFAAAKFKPGSGEELSASKSKLMRTVFWLVQFLVFALEVAHFFRIQLEDKSDDDNDNDPPRSKEFIGFFGAEMNDLSKCAMRLIIPVLVALIFSLLALVFRVCPCVSSETAFCAGSGGNCGLSNPDSCWPSNVQATTMAMNVVAVCAEIAALNVYWGWFGYLFAAMFLHIALIAYDMLVIGGRFLPNSEEKYGA
jgi:hypothetical protein